MVDIHHRIGIKAEVSKVYEALATVQGVAGWWTDNTKGDSRVGGNVDVRFFSPQGKEVGAMNYRVTALEPNKRVQWQIQKGPQEWIGTDIVFRLAESDGMTIVLFSHQNWAEPVEFMYHCSMKWGVFLLSLRELVETGTGKPSPRDIKIDNWN